MTYRVRHPRIMLCVVQMRVCASQTHCCNRTTKRYTRQGPATGQSHLHCTIYVTNFGDKIRVIVMVWFFVIATRHLQYSTHHERCAVFDYLHQGSTDLLCQPYLVPVMALFQQQRKPRSYRSIVLW